jgi:predicted RecB family nuclease
MATPSPSFVTGTAVRQKILDYNEDDCRATRVLLDGIRALAA